MICFYESDGKATVLKQMEDCLIFINMRLNFIMLPAD